MSEMLKIILLVGVIGYFGIILNMLKKKMLLLKYSLLWLLTGVILLSILLFPQTLFFITDLLGIIIPVNALFMLAILFMILILMSLTVIVSKQNKKIVILVQNIALLEERVRCLEEGEYEDRYYNVSGNK